MYKEQSDAVFRFCLIRVSNREQALDITQETFLRLWQSLSESKEIRNVRAFLFTVAHRLVIDWYRKKKSIPLDSLMYNDKDIEINLADEKTLNDLSLGAEGRYLLRTVSELDSVHQEPIYLRFVEGLSPAEIGDILGITPNAASVRVNRGIAELRRKTGYDKKE